MTNKLEKLANELGTKIIENKNLIIKADGNVLDIILDLGIGNIGCEIAHIRINGENHERYTFTYLGPYAQAYDSLLDNEFSDRINNSEQLKRLKDNLSHNIDEYYAKKDKNKRLELYSQLFQGREENGTFEDVRNSILLFAEIFLGKIDKFTSFYGDLK